MKTANKLYGLNGREDHLINIHNRKETYRAWATNADATLRENDVQDIMEGIKALQERELVAATDLREAGLEYKANLFSQYVTVESSNGDLSAVTSMNATKLDDNQSVFSVNSYALPIIHSTFSIPFRQEGLNYKTDIGSSNSMRAVMQTLDALITNGDSNISINVNGTTQVLYGYSNHPSRTQRTITDWVATDGSGLLEDVNNMMKDFLVTNNISLGMGMVQMYHANDLYGVLNQDAFAAKGDRSFKEQIKYRYPEIKDVKPLNSLAAGSVAMVVMDSDYVQLASAQVPVVVPHIKTVELQPSKFTAYCVETPVIKVDYAGKTGLVVGTKA